MTGRRVQLPGTGCQASLHRLQQAPPGQWGRGKGGARGEAEAPETQAQKPRGSGASWPHNTAPRSVHLPTVFGGHGISVLAGGLLLDHSDLGLGKPPFRRCSGISTCMFGAGTGRGMGGRGRFLTDAAHNTHTHWLSLWADGDTLYSVDTCDFSCWFWTDNELQVIRRSVGSVCGAVACPEVPEQLRPLSPHLPLPGPPVPRS